MAHIKHETLGKEFFEQYDLFPNCEFNHHLFYIGFEQKRTTLSSFPLGTCSLARGGRYGSKQLPRQDKMIQRQTEEEKVFEPRCKYNMREGNR